MRYGFHPDRSAVAFHNALTNGEANSAARNFFSVQSLERYKNAGSIFGRDADAVVGDGEKNGVFAALERDADSWRFRTSVLDRIADKILEQRHEMPLIALHGWQRIAGNFRATTLDGKFEVLADFHYSTVEVDWREAGFGADLGVGAKIVQQFVHAPGAVDDIGYEGRRLRSWFDEAATLQELRVHGDHAEGLLEVVAGDEGEAFQVRVGPGQIAVGFLAFGERLAKFLISLLDSGEHFVEGVDEHAEFVTGDLFRAKTVVAAGRDRGDGLDEARDGIGDDVAEPCGDKDRNETRPSRRNRRGA